VISEAYIFSTFVRVAVMARKFMSLPVTLVSDLN